LSLVERDGWYYFAQVPGSIGGICVLLYRLNDKRPILGRYEVCPAHDDGIALTAIAGGIEKGDTPLKTAINESYEEGGYKIDSTSFVDLGKCQLSTNQDTTIYLFSADVTNLPRYNAPGDGTKGEIGSYCDWVSVEEAIFSKSAFMSILITRLKLKTDIDLLRNQ
jgi:8-oxo-dGTP pyrophosphatase MutT (NUDIX family)